VKQASPKSELRVLRYLRAIRIMAGYNTIPALVFATGVSGVTLDKVEKNQPVSKRTLDRYGEAIGLNVEAVKLLRAGQLRPYLELKRANGKSFAFARTNRRKRSRPGDVVVDDQAEREG